MKFKKERSYYNNYHFELETPIKGCKRIFELCVDGSPEHTVQLVDEDLNKLEMYVIVRDGWRDNPEAKQELQEKFENPFYSYPL